MRIMPRTDAERQPQLPVSDPTETADLRMAVRLGSPLVVEIRGEIDIQSAAELRDELLRVIRRCGPELALDLAGVTFLDCAGLTVLLATRRRAQLEEGSVRIIRASPWVLRVISLLGLETAFALEPQVLAEVIRPLAAGLGAPMDLQVNVAEPIGMEDGMSDEQPCSPRSLWLPPVEGRPDATAV
jgi:anti-anti-sigma factor